MTPSLHPVIRRAATAIETDPAYPGGSGRGSGPVAEDGWPRSWLGVVGLLLLPFPASAGARYLTGLPMSACLVLAVGFSALVAALWWPWRERRSYDLQLWASGALFLLLVGALGFDALYDPRFDGQPTAGAIDAVGHLIETQAIAGPNPKAYYGMTSFQACAHWLMQIGLNPFWAFGVLVYAIFFGVLAYCALAQGVAAADLQASYPLRRLPWLVVAVALAIGAYPFYGYLLPMWHGYQADGYFPQLASLLVLSVMALGYGVGRARLGRLAALALGILLLRFTYFLNMVDVIATCALLVAWEAVWGESHGSPRRRLFALAVMGVVLSGLLYRELYAIADNGGRIAAPDMTLRMGGTGVLSVVLLAYPFVSRRWLLHRPAAPLVRLTTWVGIYGLVATAVQAVWTARVYARAYTEDDVYLLHKYGFSACVLAVLTAVPVAAHALTLGLASRRIALVGQRGAAALAVAAAALGGFAMQTWSVPEEYRQTYRERATRSASNMVALADMAAWSHVNAALDEVNREFGTFLAPLTAETHFSGYALRPIGNPDVLPFQNASGLPPYLDYPLLGIGNPGRCVFWLDPVLFQERDTSDLVELARRDAVRELHRGPRRCRSYRRRSRGSDPIQLCYTCLEGTAYPIPAAAFTETAPAASPGRRPVDAHDRPGAAIELSPAADERCFVRLAPSLGGADVLVDDRRLEPVTPLRLPIFAELLAAGVAHRIAIRAHRPPTPAGAATAADVVCIHRATPSPRGKSTADEHDAAPRRNDG